MKYLKELKSESKELKTISKALIDALDKTGLEQLKANQYSNIINSLILKFPFTKITLLLEIIDNGSMGKYGISYKFTPQLIGNWIYREKFLKSKTDAL